MPLQRIPGAMVSDSTITTTDVQDGSINTVDLANSAVTTAKLTAVDDGAGYERFYGYCIQAPDPCDEKSVTAALESEL